MTSSFSQNCKQETALLKMRAAVAGKFQIDHATHLLNNGIHHQKIRLAMLRELHPSKNSTKLQRNSSIDPRIRPYYQKVVNNTEKYEKLASN